jgi:hypothetical protein
MHLLVQQYINGIISICEYAIVLILKQYMVLLFEIFIRFYTNVLSSSNR